MNPELHERTDVGSAGPPPSIERVRQRADAARVTEEQAQATMRTLDEAVDHEAVQSVARALSQLEEGKRAQEELLLRVYSPEPADQALIERVKRELASRIETLSASAKRAAETPTRGTSPLTLDRAKKQAKESVEKLRRVLDLQSRIALRQPGLPGERERNRAALAQYETSAEQMEFATGNYVARDTSEAQLLLAIRNATLASVQPPAQLEPYEDPTKLVNDAKVSHVVSMMQYQIRTGDRKGALQLLERFEKRNLLKNDYDGNLQIARLKSALGLSYEKQLRDAGEIARFTTGAARGTSPDSDARYKAELKKIDAIRRELSGEPAS